MATKKLRSQDLIAGDRVRSTIGTQRAGRIHSITGDKALVTFEGEVQNTAACHLCKLIYEPSPGEIDTLKQPAKQRHRKQGENVKGKGSESMRALGAGSMMYQQRGHSVEGRGA